MQSILFLYIATEDTSSDNAFEKLKVMKEVLRSVKEILWPTNGREANVLDAVRLAVFRMERSDVFKVSHNVTRQHDGAEPTSNNMAVSVLGEECDNKLNDSMGIVGIDSKGNVAVGTTSGNFLGSLPKKGELDVYLNAGIPIGDGPPITRFNLLEEANWKCREKNTSLRDAMKESAKIPSEFMDDSSCTVVITEEAKVKFYTDLTQTILALTNGTRFTCTIDGLEFREEF